MAKQIENKYLKKKEKKKKKFFIKSFACSLFGFNLFHYFLFSSNVLDENLLTIGLIIPVDNHKKKNTYSESINNVIKSKTCIILVQLEKEIVNRLTSKPTSLSIYKRTQT